MPCTKRCETCWYVGSLRTAVDRGGNSCDYMLITGKLRGCPAGDQCTKYKEGRRPNTYMRIYKEGEMED